MLSETHRGEQQWAHLILLHFAAGDGGRDSTVIGMKGVRVTDAGLGEGVVPFSMCIVLSRSMRLALD